MAVMNKVAAFFIGIAFLSVMSIPSSEQSGSGTGITGPGQTAGAFGSFTKGDIIIGGPGTTQVQDGGLYLGVPAKTYGAKCDNATDDTVALQAGINSGVPLVLPPSICRITSNLTITASNVVIVGTKYLSAIKLDTASTGTDILHIGFQAAQINNIVLQDFTLIRAQTDATGVAVNSKLIGASTYRGLYVFGNSTVGNGLNFAGIQNVGLHDIWVQNVTGYCVQASGLNTNTASVAGPIDSLGTITGGSSYTNGTYTGVALTGGSGTLATATIVVSGGAVASVVPTPGTLQGGYKPTDVLSAAAASIGGTGSGFSVPVSMVGIISNDLRIDNLSRCDGGANGLIVGDWLSGVYVLGNIFYNQTTSAFSQSSTNIWRIQSSYHWVGNDIDTTPSAMIWNFAWDVHVVGNRFQGQSTDVITMNGAFHATITGNNMLGESATPCVAVGDNNGALTPDHIGNDVTVSGNDIFGCHFGVTLNKGAKDVTVVGNTFAAQTSDNIAANACNYSKITIGPNTYDQTLANGTVLYGCPGDIKFGERPTLLGQLITANFNITTDQAIPITTQIGAFQITAITVTNCSTNMTTAAGGFYPTTGKGGTAIVPASQVYSSATSPSVVVNAAVAATPLATRYTITNVYLSLTTAQGSAATCDVFVFGMPLG